MQIRKKYKFIMFMAIAIIVIVSLFIFYRMTFKEELPYCERLRSGVVSAEIRYPSDFVLSENFAKEGFIEISKKDNESDSVLSLIAQPNYITSIEELLNTKQIDPGPVFEKIMFNGHEAAFLKVEDEETGTWEHYRIPLGNRIIELDYHPSVLSEDKKQLAQKMLDSVIFTETEEDTIDSRVENCRK